MNQLRNSFSEGSHEQQNRLFAHGVLRSRVRNGSTLRTQTRAGWCRCLDADIAAAIIHEISQPLTAILANAQASLLYLSAENANPDALKKAVLQIVRDSEEAAWTVRSIRTLFRRGSSNTDPVKLPSVLGDVLVRLDSEIRRRAIRTRISIDPGVRAVAGDERQLRQLLRNLISNAMDSMEQNSEISRELEVRVSPKGRMVVTEVADRGHGIADCNDVFGSGITTKGSGMGMGLRICRKIIEAHKGQLWANSRCDRGTVFSFSLPLA